MGVEERREMAGSGSTESIEEKGRVNCLFLAIPIVKVGKCGELAEHQIGQLNLDWAGMNILSLCSSHLFLIINIYSSYL